MKRKKESRELHQGGERWRTKRSRGEFGTVLHVWQYTVCPCCKHEGRHSLRSAEADSVEESASLLPVDTDGT